MQWSNIRLIFLREFRDQLRDRRTMFTIVVLPLLLYPLLGLTMMQVAQFLGEHRSVILLIAGEPLSELPPLVDQQQFTAELRQAPEGDLLDVVLSEDPPAGAREEALRQLAAQRTQHRKFDAVVVIPAGFGQALSRFQAELSASDGEPGERPAVAAIPPLEVITNKASQQSRIAGARVESVLRLWRQKLVEQSLANSRVPLAATRPFEVTDTDVAPAEVRRAAMWSKILPFVVLIWALTGAFYPAIDLCAGEKERGTLETLLCCPALRSEIVWGKLLTIMLFSAATALLNLVSMGMTGAFVIGRLDAMQMSGAAVEIGPPPLAALAWLLLALPPIAALFSALSLAIAAFARSSKEGQYYLMPLLIINLPLMMLSVLPAAELNLGTSLIPVTGILLLLQALIEGRYLDALPFVLPVVGVTAICCLLAIRWAIHQFQSEAVLFRESERWGLRVWLRHVLRDRGETPSFGEAMLCGVMLLVIGFFASFFAPQSADWRTIAASMLIVQVGLIAAPALLMTIMLTRNPRRTLLLETPRPAAIPAALLLAVTLHPLVGQLGKFVQWLYPLSDEMLQALRPLEASLEQAPLWQLLLVVALVPAVCEELAFRGFVLSGLRHVGHKWTAIVVASLLFGLAHGILQQKLTTCVIGVVIGYLAVQSGSLWPCIVFHATNNALVLLVGRLDAGLLERAPVWQGLFRAGQDDTLEFHWPVVALAALLSLALLFWFRALPYQRYDEERLREALDQRTNEPPALAESTWEEDVAAGPRR
ncbi:MAG: CPBP family intramembrane metalloprotease [Pirellulaceae bacterium]|nr:CPBP family intramembrane metalloprotease [Pirellulaceae bacterium]